LFSYCFFFREKKPKYIQKLCFLVQEDIYTTTKHQHPKQTNLYNINICIYNTNTNTNVPTPTIILSI